MTKFEELQAAHERLLEQSKAPQDVTAFVTEVQREIQNMCVAAEDIPAPRERDQLRAILRFWASYVYDHTGTYPDTTLRPADEVIVGRVTHIPSSQRPPLLRIALAAGVVFIVLLVVVLLIVKPVAPAPAIVTTPDKSVIVETTTGQPSASSLQIQYAVLTAGPSPFDADAWAVKVQLSATGGNDSYIFWANGQSLPDVSNNQFVVEGEKCISEKPIVGVTSDGQATSLELVIQSPLLSCPQS